MIPVVAAALSTANPPLGLAATVQATITIRVLRGVTLRLDGSSNPEAPPPRATLIRSSDGSVERAQLIDFQ
jgi:hypothetical protein